MPENPSPARFNAEMPQIPGIGSPSGSTRRRSPLLLLAAGAVVLGAAAFLGVRWVERSRTFDPAGREPIPQIDVPPAPPDPATLLPHADPTHPVIAEITALARPWSSADFFFRSSSTGEDIPATIIRLPGRSAGQAGGYWAFSRRAPYGSCQLEYITDLKKLRSEYGYRAASHPLVGNPCSHTLYDPLKTANLAGNVFVRGGIVQGGDIRPPFGVEIRIRGKEILAIRSE